MTLEEQLQDAYEHAAELAPVSPGAYDRFLRRRVRHGRVVAATAGLALVAVLGAAVLIARQLPQDRAPATNAAEPTPGRTSGCTARSSGVEYGGHKPVTIERWDRVDGKQFARPTNDRRTNGAPKVRRERMDFPSFQKAVFPRCPDKPARIPPPSALGAGSQTPLPCPPTPTGCWPPSTSWSRTPNARPFPSATPSRTEPSC